MFKPHVTVACVVHAEGKFLVVEETINGKALWNQPVFLTSQYRQYLAFWEHQQTKAPGLSPRLV